MNKLGARLLEGQRLYLRPLAQYDTNFVLRWRADTVVHQQLFSGRPPTRSEHEAWFADLQRRNDRLEFMIVMREGEQPVGTIGLSRIDYERGEAEYGILIGEAAWRSKGVAFEGSELLFQYAFEMLKLRRIILRVFVDNTSARALYRRLGFVEDIGLAGWQERNEIRRLTMTMSLTQEVWKHRH